MLFPRARSKGNAIADHILPGQPDKQNRDKESSGRMPIPVLISAADRPDRVTLANASKVAMRVLLLCASSSYWL